jgi:hypothetical protein
MTINAKQFSTQIVIPTLQMLDQQAGIPYTGKLVWEKHVAEAEKYELMIRDASVPHK